MSDNIGFNNSYQIGMLKSRANELNITTISDLADHPDLVCGFSREFLERDDGWGKLSATYQLSPQRKPLAMDHAEAYRALFNGKIDVTNPFGTDPEHTVTDETRQLLVLTDDKHFFPDYHAVALYREEIKNPAERVLMNLRISDDEMRRINGRLLSEEAIRHEAVEFSAELVQTQTRVYFYLYGALLAVGIALFMILAWRSLLRATDATRPSEYGAPAPSPRP
jgi:osmoprotectant transport system permease protein